MAKEKCFMNVDRVVAIFKMVGTMHYMSRVEYSLWKKQQKHSQNSRQTSWVLFSAGNGKERKNRRKRMEVGISETDHYSAGGLFPDSLYTSSLKPWYWKIDPCLQLATPTLSTPNHPCVLLFSGEESGFQVLERAKRLGSVPWKILNFCWISHWGCSWNSTTRKPISLSLIRTDLFFPGRDSQFYRFSTSSLPSQQIESLMYPAKAKHIRTLLDKSQRWRNVYGPQLWRTSQMPYPILKDITADPSERPKSMPLHTQKLVFLKWPKPVQEVQTLQEVFSLWLPSSSVIFPAEGQRPFC